MTYRDPYNFVFYLSSFQFICNFSRRTDCAGRHSPIVRSLVKELENGNYRINKTKCIYKVYTTAYDIFKE